MCDGVPDDAFDCLGHGTTCTNLLLKLTAEVDVVPIRVFRSRLETSPSATAAAIDWATAAGIEIVNLSLGTVRMESAEILYAACARAAAAGVVLVAASGVGPAPSFPAVFDNVLSVGSGRIPLGRRFTYHPDELIECVAPGFAGAAPAAGDSFVGSSSFAAPRVTAVVAEIKRQLPDATLADVRAVLGTWDDRDHWTVHDPRYGVPHAT